jgi:hypothetical protein
MKKEEKSEQANLSVVTAETINQFLFGSGTKLTDEQKALFIETAVAFQLNPFKREIYAVPYEEKWYDKQSGRKVSYNPPRYKFSIITRYEVYLKRGDRTGKLDGWYTEYDGKDCTIIIYRKDWTHPFKHTIDISEYDGNGNMWKTKRRTMSEKTCISQGFRRAFPDELGGMPYTREELPDEMTTVTVEGQVVDAKPITRADTVALPPVSANEELGNTKTAVTKQEVKQEAPVAAPVTKTKKEKKEAAEAAPTPPPVADKKADFNSALYPVVFSDVVKRHADSKPEITEGGSGYIPWEDNGPDAVSKKQHDLISKLMLSSHVREKDKLNCLRALSGPLAKAKASEIIDYMLRTIKAVEDGVKKIMEQLQIVGEGADPKWEGYIREWYTRLDKNSWTKIISSGINEELKGELDDYLEQKNNDSTEE